MIKNLTLTGTFCFFLALNGWAQPKADAATVKQLIAKNATALGLTADDVTNTRVSSSYYDAKANAVMAYLQQTYKGVDVYNAISSVAFRDDNVISATQGRISEVEKLISEKTSIPTLKPLTALRIAAADLNLPITQSIAIPVSQTADGQEFVFDRMGVSYNNIPVRLNWLPVSTVDNRLQLSWNVTILVEKSNDLWSVKVDALTGKVLSKSNLTSKEIFKAANLHKLPCFDPPSVNNIFSENSVQAINSAKYTVIPYPNQDPNFTSPTSVTNPWSIFPNTNATSLKWNNDGSKDYDSTKGNNVYAHFDPKAKDKNGGAGISSTALPDLTFGNVFNFNTDPVDEAGINTNASATNLFYWNNILHDFSYQYGFDEVAGNFQASNQGRGGKEKDFVTAGSQYGQGGPILGILGDTTGYYLNNANFSTPADGSGGIMHMYLWSPSLLKPLVINPPTIFSGDQFAREGSVSANNKLYVKAIYNTDVVLYKDLFSDSSNACGGAANAADLKGKIAYIDRGSCSFVLKYQNAQAAGAKGIIVGNVAYGDPRYPGTQLSTTGNFIVTMGGTDNSIIIPGVFTGYDSAQKMKNLLKAGQPVNVNLLPAYRLDGDLDNGVISHEYMHGISNRLTGGPNNTSCLSNGEQMGEGWSDYNALMMTTDWAAAKITDGALPRAIGNYAAGYTPLYGGIRNYPYTTDFSIDPWTYDSLRTDTSIHEYNSSTNPGVIYLTGEVWCSTLWDMTWEIIKSEGINKTFWDPSKPGGNSIAYQLVLQGLKLQKCSPGCVDGRDGILAADTLLYGGKYSPAIWRAFAKRGLGFGADEKSNQKIKDGIGSYLLPSVLPAIFGNFTAEKVNSTAVLKWTTLTEINVDRFVVERTIDGRNYTEVGAIKATGSSTRVQSYTFTDLKPVKGTNIYRIRLVDRDNKASYTDARSLVFADIKNLISLAPNPARDKVVLTVKENRKPLQVKLFNNLGEQVASFILSGESMPIDISRFTTGAYYISITGEGINQKEKLIIQ